MNNNNSYIIWFILIGIILLTIAVVGIVWGIKDNLKKKKLLEDLEARKAARQRNEQSIDSNDRDDDSNDNNSYLSSSPAIDGSSEKDNNNNDDDNNNTNINITINAITTLNDNLATLTLQKQAVIDELHGLEKDLVYVRAELDNSNNILNTKKEELAEVNGKLVEVNDRLVETNDKLVETNNELTEANNKLVKVNDELALKSEMHRIAIIKEKKEKGGGGGLTFSGMMTAADKNLNDIVVKLQNDYPELRADFGAILWRKIWMPKIQSLVKLYGLDGKRGIYRIRCLVEGKENVCYIGQAQNIKERWYTHIKKMVGAEVCGNEKIYKTGLTPDCFEWEVLQEVKEGRMDEVERYWIEFFAAELNSR